MATYRLDDRSPHAFWDQSLPPRLEIRPGDTVVFETLEASAGQITPRSKSAALATLSFEPIHPLTGPVFVRGAEPGDALEVQVVVAQAQGLGLERRAARLRPAGRRLHRRRTCTTTR